MKYRLNVIESNDVTNTIEIVRDDGSVLYTLYGSKDGSIELDFDNPCDFDYLDFPADVVALLMEAAKIFGKKNLIDQITSENINIDRDWEKLE